MKLYIYATVAEADEAREDVAAAIAMGKIEPTGDVYAAIHETLYDIEPGELYLSPVSRNKIIEAYRTVRWVEEVLCPRFTILPGVLRNLR